MSAESTDTNVDVDVDDSTADSGTEMEEYLDDLDSDLGCAELWEAMYDRRNPDDE